MEYQVDLLPKVKSKWWFRKPGRGSDPNVFASARTGKIGDGKIFVFDVAEAIRIRNDDSGKPRCDVLFALDWRTIDGSAPLTGRIDKPDVRCLAT